MALGPTQLSEFRNYLSGFGHGPPLNPAVFQNLRLLSIDPTGIATVLEVSPTPSEVDRFARRLWAGRGVALVVEITSSWQCFLNCQGKIIDRMCSDTPMDTVNCCELLRTQCRGP